MASKRRARRDDNAAATRRAILDAARQAFARTGYAATSLDAIVGAARLTKGALYHHFKSKAAVFEALYAEMENELAREVQAAVGQCRGSSWDRVVAAVAAFFSASAETEYVQIVLRDAPQVLGPAQSREIDQAIGLALIVQLLSELFEDGGIRLPMIATARVVLAAVSEVAVTMAYARDPARARREGTTVILALLAGLLVTPASERPGTRPRSSTAARSRRAARRRRGITPPG